MSLVNGIILLFSNQILVLVQEQTIIHNIFIGCLRLQRIAKYIFVQIKTKLCSLKNWIFSLFEDIWIKKRTFFKKVDLENEKVFSQILQMEKVKRQFVRKLIFLFSYSNYISWRNLSCKKGHSWNKHWIFWG